MRTALFGALLAIGVAAMPLTSKPSHAMALTAPAGLSAAADALSDTQKVWYYRPYYGYGYYRTWRPYYYGYYRPWRPYYYGYYRPWRPYYVGYYRPWRPYYGYYRPWFRPAFYGPRFYGGWGWRRGWW